MPNNRQTYWIIGAGRFGTRAVRTLLKLKGDPLITLVDCDPQKLTGWKDHIKTVSGDGIDYLTRQMKPNQGVDWIVPAIPRHLAFEWIYRTLRGKLKIQMIRTPENIKPKLPNSFGGENGELYVSHADFRCPDNCPEPRNFCTVTQKSRPTDMFHLLAKLGSARLESIVIRSHQLAPGVGGFKPQTLMHARTMVENSAGKALISTACRCHGVVHAVIRSPR